MADLEDSLQVIENNRRNSFTVPSEQLYPYQWNWDSAFIALGISSDKALEAREELNQLYESQWENGMIPQIAFWRDAEGYFPGPDEWQTGNGKVETSGITQPPMVVHAAKKVLETLDDSEFLQKSAKSLKNYMEWWINCRSYDGRLVYVRHPWETGMDDSPAWIKPLEKIDPGNPEYERKDLKNDDSSKERPENWDYDRYVYLLRQGRDYNWNEEKLREFCPFQVADILTNSIFARACEELAEIMEMNGEPEKAEKWRMQGRKTSEAINERMWSAETKNFVSIDLWNEEKLMENSAAGFVTTYAGIPDQQKHEKMIENLENNFMGKKYIVPSYVGKHYNPEKYWRGPIWINLNWLIAKGMKRTGETEISRQITEDSKELVETNGYREYFNPETGEPHGSEKFSWTAALYRTWLLS